MKPIITDLKDTDKYKFLEQEFIRTYYPDVQAQYEFFVRGGINPLCCIDLKELADQLHAIPIDGDTSFELSSTGSGTLATFPKLVFSGRWADTCMWETYAMSIISEMYGRGKATSHGESQLHRKMSVLAGTDIHWTDFGTRRRHSKEWHERVVEEGIKSGMAGTSNVMFAEKYGIPCVGTMPHSIFMGVAALHDHAPSSLRGSQQIVLKQWEQLHGPTIALTDTWGSDFFFEDFTDKQYREWQGLRQDSGDPLVFTENAIYKYAQYGDLNVPKDLVYSDGLTLEDILLIRHRYKNNKNIKQKFGWGTNLTNDVGYDPPKMVIKLTEIEGRSTVKLSDTPGKEQGTHSKVFMYQEELIPTPRRRKPFCCTTPLNPR